MRLSACCFCTFFFGVAHVSAQQVVEVSRVEMFKTSGTINGVATSESAIGTAKPTAPTTVTRSGGTITTGADGAASLMLGEGAETGSVRMGPDSEVKVPDAGEKGHSLEMLKGSLFMKIDATQLKQRDGAEFKLKTPAALLAVKGTKFFSRTNNGTDTVGVHEGSVELTEPTTGQKLTLTAGQAAEVSPGVLSAMREMTTEEKGSADTYALAELPAIPLAVFMGLPGAQTPLSAWVDGKVQNNVPNWTTWRRMNSSIWAFYSTGQLTADGGIQVSRSTSISFRLAPRRGEPVRDALGVPVRPLILPKEMKALRFRMRQVGFNGLRLGTAFGSSQNSEFHALPADAPEWREYQFSVPTLSKPSASKDSKDLEYLLIFQFQTVGKEWDRSIKRAFEIKDFTLLVLP